MVNDAIKLAILGDSIGVREAKKSIKYQNLISKIIVWEEDFLDSFDVDALVGIDIVVFAFRTVNKSVIQLKKLIISAYSIMPDCVLDYYRLIDLASPMMRGIKRIDISKNERIDGIILGLSHAEVGIIPGRLSPYYFLNLAVSSSDIYSNYKTFEYFYNKYPERLMSLKYLIFDMFDYSYFNYDVSRSANYINYLLWGGYNLDSHNFDKNPSYEGITYEEMITNLEGYRKDNVSQNSIDFWNMIRSDYRPMIGQEDSAFDPYYRLDIVNEDKIQEFKIGKYSEVEYENTIKENMEYFEKTLKIAYGINSDIKVFIVNMPRYSGAYEIEKDMIEHWKDRFYEIIGNFQKEYHFEFLDYAGSEWAEDKNLFFDAEHFNTYGAMKFTDMFKTLL